MNEPATESRPHPAASRRTWVVLLFASLAIGLFVGYWMYTPQVNIEDIEATVLEPPRPTDDFQLVTHRGAPFTLNSLRGKWSFVFFGYTHCPDVCPTTLQTLAHVTDKITRSGQQDLDTQVVFVSVDPERDTPERLSNYVPYFSDAFVGVTGTTPEMHRFTRQLGILHLRTQTDGADDYVMDHTASVLLFNPEGELRVLFPAPHQTENIVDDFLKVVRL